MADSANFPVPPANFQFLVESILMQAQMQLGLFKFGGKEDEEEAEPNLPLARHSIDLLAMLEEKTRNNLTMEESRLLSNGLTELRFSYVQISDELTSGKSSGQSGSESEESSRIIMPDDDAPRIITPGGGKGIKTS